MDSNYYIKKIYNKKLPLYICILGFLVPCGVAFHKKLQMKRLEDGIKRDMERIQNKGKKFSDIPKSF